MRRIACLTIAALIVTACGGSTADETTTTESTGGAVATTEAPTTTAAPETTTTTAAPTTTTTVAALGGADCLVGSWELVTDAFVSEMQEAFAAESTGMTLTPLDGSYLIEMQADGTMTSERENWGFAASTPEGDVTMTFNGTETGTWAVNGETLSVSITESDVQADFAVVVDGEELSLPGGNQLGFSTETATVSGSGEFECEGDTVTLNTTDETSGTEITSMLRRR